MVEMNLAIEAAYSEDRLDSKTKEAYADCVGMLPLAFLLRDVEDIIGNKTH